MNRQQNNLIVGFLSRLFLACQQVWARTLVATLVILSACGAAQKPGNLRLVADGVVRVEVLEGGAFLVDEQLIATFEQDGLLRVPGGSPIARVTTSGFQIEGGPNILVLERGGVIQIGRKPDGGGSYFQIRRNRSVRLPTKRPPGNEVRFENLTTSRTHQAMLILVIIQGDECDYLPEVVQKQCQPLMWAMGPR